MPFTSTDGATLPAFHSCTVNYQLIAPGCQPSAVGQVTLTGMPCICYCSTINPFTCFVPCATAALQPPEVKVTMGNVLLVRVPTLSYVTGDSLANNFLKVESFEVDCGPTEGGIVSVPSINLLPQRAGRTPAFAVYSIRYLGGVGPVRSSCSYRIRVVVSKQPGMACPFVFQLPQDTRLISSWTASFTTLPAR